MSDFTENLKLLRRTNKISQKELAEELNVTQTAVNYWENGKREPGTYIIEKIAQYFNISPSELMGWDENEFIKEKKYVEDRKREIAHNLRFGTDIRGEKAGEMLEKYFQLNDIGQDKAFEQVELLTKIPEYRKNPDESQED